MTIEDTINERDATHGDWRAQSALAWTLKNQIKTAPNYELLSMGQREALDMICVKISRIVTGNALEPDHWRDIEGYARLGGL